MTESLREIYRTHAESQSKYVYFLLASAGAALGYALQKLDGHALTWWAAPGLIAVGCWLGSFFCGCKRITWVHSAMYANYALLQLQHGRHPDQPPHPQAAQAAMDGTRSAIVGHLNMAQRYFKFQFWLLALGVMCFVFWRISEMARVSSYGP